MSRKRILWLIKGLGRGGAEKLIESSLPYFDRDKFEYEIAYFLPYKNDVVPSIKKANIPVYCPDVTSALDVAGLVRLGRLLHERKPDILHIHLPFTGILGRTIGRLAGVKNIVYTEHNIIEKFHPVTRFLNLLTYPMNHTAIAVSEEVERSMERHWLSRRSNHIVIKNGIELGREQTSPENLAALKKTLNIPLSHKIVGNVAHIRPEKGHEFLIQAAKLVIDQFPQVTFVVVGREKYSGEIDRLNSIAKSFHIEDRVIFTGYRDDVPVLMDLFDIFTLSSLAEGLPLALLEAMLRGKPAVSTSVGGVPEVIQDGKNGFLVESRNPEQLAQKILRLLEDEDLSAKISHEAVITVEKQFGIESMIKKIEGVYTTVLDI